jgi:GNAT superfamily N-acetyltransferase
VPVSYEVEPATGEELEELAALRLAQGWHATRPLLAALLDWDRARIFVVREPRGAGAAGGVIATTAAIACDGVGVIGNVIVRTDWQRRGLGELVMERTLAWQRGRGVRSVLLDATVAGRPLYRKLGFVPTATSWFAHCALTELRRTVLDDRADNLPASLRPAGDLARLAALDAAAFGGDRLGLLARMLRRPEVGLVVAEDERGQPQGYALVRPIERPNGGVQIGPWVARDERAAAATMRAALGPRAPWREALGGMTEHDVTLHAGMSGMHVGAMEFCDALGLRLVEDDLLMQLDFGAAGGAGEARSVGGPQQTAAHPEWVYSWLAPMVF